MAIVMIISPTARILNFRLLKYPAFSISVTSLDQTKVGLVS